MNILGGLILPVWGSIEKALSKQVRNLPAFVISFSIQLSIGLFICLRNFNSEKQLIFVALEIYIHKPA